ncbi:glycogenin-2 isoform X1 [Alosa sapidissima]|uniref:glycogenin-2 isoform X1 n=1 Tax=Alosa sapidissima TaxID=34773 RepID=UPI001C0A1A0D|nr:glycogenin-2 isoform X1 [Alosa sapidissima]
MPAPHVADQAFVTLATTDAYCMGALVVGKSLRHYGTSRRIVVMVSPNVSLEARRPLEFVFDEVLQVNVLDSGNRAHLSWLGRPELGVTFTKLHCWMLLRYHKCVFLDADTLVLSNIDELFEREELSAAPDAGWPDCFNSGVFVFRPSLHTHTRLLEHAAQHGSFDGGDQGLLNSFFSDWAVADINKHLPFIYNLSASAFYTYLPAFQRYGYDAKIVHFLGGVKPWHCSFNPQANQDSGSQLDQYVKLWWEEYLRQTPPTVATPDPRELSKMKHSAVTAAQTPPAPPRVQLPVSDSLPPEVRVPLPSRPPPAPTDLTIHVLPPPAPPTPQNMHTDLEEKGSDWTGHQDPPPGEGGGDSWAEASSSASAASDEQVSLSLPPVESEEEKQKHRRLWEEGHMDYLGKDSFQNIKKKLDRFLK